MNKYLWQSRNERQRLEQLCWDAPDPNSSLHLPNRFQATERGLRAHYPQWFRDKEDQGSDNDQILFRSIAEKIDDAAKGTGQLLSELSKLIVSAEGSRGSELGQWRNVSAKITRQVEAIVQRVEQKIQRLEKRSEEGTGRIGEMVNEVKAVFSQADLTKKSATRGLLWVEGVRCWR
jgi:hypothetical protein